MLEELAVTDDLRARVEAWIQRKRDLCLTRAKADVPKEDWISYDQEGRELARRLRTVFEPDAEVYYFCEASEEYEPVV